MAPVSLVGTRIDIRAPACVRRIIAEIGQLSATLPVAQPSRIDRSADQFKTIADHLVEFEQARIERRKGRLEVRYRLHYGGFRHSHLSRRMAKDPPRGVEYDTRLLECFRRFTAAPDGVTPFHQRLEIVQQHGAVPRLIAGDCGAVATSPWRGAIAALGRS